MENWTLGLWLAADDARRGRGPRDAMLRGEKLERPAAVISQSVMAGLSAAYTVLGVRGLLRA